MPPRSRPGAAPSASISRASIPSATTTDALKSGYLSRVNCGVVLSRPTSSSSKNGTRGSSAVRYGRPTPPSRSDTDQSKPTL